ncbi:MAG TPA: ATP-binding cassette domain-containing protein [Candidatus Baltobacteraceae bacterium]|nr:ATP-binding cassette domain-containing protein [Candidatus Baltobacteraceae bacterium]
MTSLVAFRDAGVAYAGRWVWRGATFSVAPGEFVAVIGPNGAGKTTLLKAALGAIAPTEGSVLIDGAPPRRGTVRIGYAPQIRPVAETGGIRSSDVVRFGVDGHRWGLPLPGRRSSVARERVDEALASVGATAYASRRTGELSGGELQRVMLAQALVRRPRLLVLDEPVANLDLASRAEFIALVAGLARDGGVAVLFVTHDLYGLRPSLDGVVRVAGGRVDTGPPEALLPGDAP